ncbi:MAG: type II toxin-antitoxin system VapC family toxin [Candidatus Scalindua sp. AMX11]|nr:MAG: type II toxin-antitoxin system VapC family toxin [Candidatus Scalindua sp.]RZV68742.1 MAG: type II toxin-antitoxin system VapC family toxin [Candidatus Scalindua sp. SCAELEC01]TDE63833.1 MAG: type II toxin-antitoxin system VapC family toxin [Candidatus Scalindua sp. AMX11]
MVDTNIFIDVENDRLDLKDLAALSHYGDAYISAITVSELLTGVHVAKSTDVRIQRSTFVEGIIARVPVLDFTEEIARTYAELYAYFLKPRRKSGGNVHDLQIAATAITHSFAVLTGNAEDFKKIPGLKIETP